MPNSFRIVEMTNKDAFCNEIETLLDEGWELHGDMKIIYDPSSEVPETASKYIQALKLHRGYFGETVI